MRFRIGVIAMAISLVFISACSSSGKSSSSDQGLGGETSTTTATNAACKNAQLTSPEVGVTPTTITVTVVADVQNAFRPGLFKGSWDGVKAWGNYINANGGLACRKVVVKEADSQLSGPEAKAAVATACGDSLALTGTTALFLADVSGMNSCKDKTGKATGLPDFAELQTEPVQQCSPVSFAALPNSASCPYSGTGPRTYSVGYTQYDYYLKKYPNTPLHGVFAIPKDVNSTIVATMPIIRAENKMGIKSDFELGMSGTATQPGYTPLVQQIKTHNSNYARNGLDYKGTVLERKEAAAQGVNDKVLVWDCSLQCYDKRLIGEGGAAVDKQYVWLSFLPMEDGKGVNPELTAFLTYDKNPDGFGMQAWVAAEVFARAVNDAIKANGNNPNAITRADILAATKNIHDFTANGLVPPTDIGNRKGSVCLVGMQVQNGKLVRVDPTTPGQFDCDGNKPPLVFTIDPKAEYKG